MLCWLSGFWARTGSVANCGNATFFQALSRSRCAGGGEYGPCPDFANYTLAFALQLRKITENLSQGSRKALGWSATNAIRLVDLAIASTGLLAPAALGFRVRRRGQPSVSVSICICRVAVIGDSPRQLTSSQSSQSGLWCGWQTAEHPDPCVSACY